ncbi:MAG: hypothetical protein AUJ75_01475 [Candidatus Omnitrophica bacterium CG1_02_49_10]|nr:MAG: hypothetical protein AUJ75_01475 [Candidatus Omnitrophica bacterium CG1_02_49_10]
MKGSRRILLVRTDRIGDVVLSTPAIKAVRAAYPDAYIAAMVRPPMNELLQGSGYLDDVIVYDKYGRHNSFLSSLFFAFKIKKKRFDTAVIMHPTTRAHIAAFLAGIPRRIGWRINGKMSFLLTERLEHTKQRGEKHEVEYTLDLIRLMGIEPGDKKVFVARDSDADRRAEDFFKSNGLVKDRPIIGFNPSSSSPSKMWPVGRFAVTADRIAGELNADILILSGGEDEALAREMAAAMKVRPLVACGRPLKDTVALIARCALFISNDSGPVHIACAIGVPAISIFGRIEPGLGYKRWGPTGERSIALHKDVGCKECLADNCKIGFKCLAAVAPDDVISSAKQLLNK